VTDPKSSEGSLGLVKGVVSLRPYHRSWAALGEHERIAVRTLLGPIAADVQHVGSTAIPGLDAKPILDIAVALERNDKVVVSEIVRRMIAGGYEYRGDRGPDGGLLFVRASGMVRTVHVHMVPRNDLEWDHYIRFRDYLRTSPERCREYAALKRQLAARYPTDREAYTHAKAVFVVETLQLADEERASGRVSGTQGLSQANANGQEE
jgi:GrpB-like predicted nucleotidyltransferase (UPF0157 family)